MRNGCVFVSYTDTVLLRYLKLGIQDHHLILVASQDEASYQ